MKSCWKRYRKVLNDPYDWNNDRCLHRLPLYRNAVSERLTLFERDCPHVHGHYGGLDDGRGGVLLTHFSLVWVWVRILWSGNQAAKHHPARQDRNGQLPAERNPAHGRGTPQTVWIAKAATRTDQEKGLIPQCHTNAIGSIT